MTFTVTSASFQDGATLLDDQIYAGGLAPSASSVIEAGMFASVQCQKPEPVGASASKQVTAKLFVPSGAPDQLSCGDRLPPA